MLQKGSNIVPDSQPRYNLKVNPKTYFTIAGVFFIADAVGHMIRLILWWQTGYIMQIPLWLSFIAVFFSGFLGWQGLRFRMAKGG